MGEFLLLNLGGDGKLKVIINVLLKSIYLEEGEKEGKKDEGDRKRERRPLRKTEKKERKKKKKEKGCSNED